jgi:hypothetical protein
MKAARDQWYVMMRQLVADECLAERFLIARLARTFAALFPKAKDEEGEKIRAGHVLGLLSLAEHLEGVRHTDCPGCAAIDAASGVSGLSPSRCGNPAGVPEPGKQLSTGPAQAVEPPKDSDICAWCNRTFKEHDEDRIPEAFIPRTPCLGLRRGFWKSSESPVAEPPKMDVNRMLQLVADACTPDPDGEEHQMKADLSYLWLDDQTGATSVLPRGSRYEIKVDRSVERDALIVSLFRVRFTGPRPKPVLDLVQRWYLNAQEELT